MSGWVLSMEPAKPMGCLMVSPFATPFSVVLPVCDDEAWLLDLLSSLVASTTTDAYELVVVDRGSTDGTSTLLAQLDGDLVVQQLGRGASALDAWRAGVDASRNPVVVLVAPGTVFPMAWNETFLGAEALMGSGAVRVPRADLLPGLQALAGSKDVVSRVLGQSQAHPDGDLTACCEAAGVTIEEQRASSSTCPQVPVDDATPMTRPVPEAGPSQPALARPQPSGSASPLATPDLGIPANLLGNGVGAALGQVLVAGMQGARVGELPLEAAERLRERLWQEEERRQLLEARAGRDVCWTDEGEQEPLVTVRIATFNRPDELMEIALPAVLRQSYERLDVLVVGDHTDERTIDAMRSVRDPRVRFFDLPSPSAYPKERWGWWLVSGSPPMNLGIELAAGSWIAPADDDDEMTDDHVEVLLAEARRRRLEFVWSQTLMETPDGWQVLGAEPLGPGATTAGAIMWSTGLRFMRMSTTCWKVNEPHDGNMWRRMHEIGVHMGFLPRITYKYYMGTNLREQLAG